jgi:hypothetical protein
LESSNAYAIATLIAIVVGPILAVAITRFIDRKVEARGRKLQLFRNLMQTRGLRIDPTHVAALNTVEIEFYGESQVVAAYKSYIEHLSAPMPTVDEQVRFFEQRTDLFMNLLHKMGTALKYRFDKRDLERLSYVPQGWDAQNTLQQDNARKLNQLLSNERALPITNFLSSNSPYPKPPEVE